MVKRKRGRPPKNRGNHNTIQTLKKKSASESKTARRRADNDGNATRDHVMYCRIKLQKILLRTPHLKVNELTFVAIFI